MLWTCQILHEERKQTVHTLNGKATVVISWPVVATFALLFYLFGFVIFYFDDFGLLETSKISTSPDIKMSGLQAKWEHRQPFLLTWMNVLMSSNVFNNWGVWFVSLWCASWVASLRPVKMWMCQFTSGCSLGDMN